jgi:nucleoside-diphosphate-sugar epimerase
MNLLITGASGFIGKHLFDEFSCKTDLFRLITRKKQKISDYEKILNIEVIEADISNRDSLNLAFDNIDVLIHMAAETKSNGDFRKTNVTGVENLAHFCIEKNVKRVIHLSSVGVYGQQYKDRLFNVTEENLFEPKNDYERSKLESEQIFLRTLSGTNTELVILRPTNVFGELGQKNTLLNFFSMISNGRPFVHAPQSRVNYVYVKDVAHRIMQFVYSDSAQGVFNVGKSFDALEFLQESARVLGRRSFPVAVPVPILNVASAILPQRFQGKIQSVSNYVQYDDSRIRKLLGEDKFDLRIGLQNTARYFQDQGLLP